MTTNRLITMLVLLCLALGANAKKKKQDYPRSEIKVSYNYHYKFWRGSDGVVEKDTPFILLANHNESKFYCPSTEYRDSLLSTPSGSAKEKKCLMLQWRHTCKIVMKVLWTRWYITRVYM